MPQRHKITENHKKYIEVPTTKAVGSEVFFETPTGKSVGSELVTNYQPTALVVGGETKLTDGFSRRL